MSPARRRRPRRSRGDRDWRPDGDGSVTVRDVSLLLEAFDRPAVAAVPSAFDSTGDGRVNVLDVAELLAAL